MNKTGKAESALRVSLRHREAGDGFIPLERRGAGRRGRNKPVKDNRRPCGGREQDRGESRRSNRPCACRKRDHDIEAQRLPLRGRANRGGIDSTRASGMRGSRQGTTLYCFLKRTFLDKNILERNFTGASLSLHATRTLRGSRPTHTHVTGREAAGRQNDHSDGKEQPQKQYSVSTCWRVELHVCKRIEPGANLFVLRQIREHRS
jgi:hypothetical protein